MRTKLALLAIVLAMTACAIAPAQEMSDARQAIRSAEEMGAALYSPQRLRQAQQLLEQAQKNLEAGAYFDARRLAVDAQDEAILAREEARSQRPNP